MRARTILAAFLALAPAAQAGGFDPRHVPADAAWVVHVDLEALSRSALLRALHAADIELENEFDLDQLEKDFGLNAFTDLHSLTFYGVGAHGEQSVCVAVGSEALAGVHARLVSGGGQVAQVGGCQALILRNHGAPSWHALLPANPDSQRIALAAPSEAAFTKAWGTLKGAHPTLESAAQAAGPDPAHDACCAKSRTGTIAARPAQGSLVFAACVPVAQAEDNATYLDRAFGLLRQLADLSREDARGLALASHALEFELVEVSGEMRLRLALDTASAAKAAEAQKLLRSSLALAPLPSDAPETARRVTELTAALKLSMSNERITASLRYPASRFVDDIVSVEQARGAKLGR